MKKLLPLAALVLLQQFAAAPAALAQASAAQAAGRTKPSPLAPGELVAAAPKGDWTAIPASDLLVMDLAPDAKGKPRRVVIQLMPPPFSQGWIGNIRTLAAAHWWDGLSINRVQDNYVVQWGDASEKKVQPAGLVTVPESDYLSEIGTLEITYRTKPLSKSKMVLTSTMTRLENAGGEDYPVFLPDLIPDAYASLNGFLSGWPVGMGYSGPVPGKPPGTITWPVHCYGMVGVGRDLSPNTGSGAELYVVIGHAPRHLDRNIALVGRAIEGIEFLSSLPRGHGGLGFYDLEQGDERVTITAIHPGTEVTGLPAYEYLSTESASFAKYADARANRRDAFFIRPAGGADICNIPVPVRRVK